MRIKRFRAGPAYAGQFLEVSDRGLLHGLKITEGIPEQTGRGRPYSRQTHDFPGHGSTCAGAAVTGDGETMGGVAYLLQKKDLRASLPERKGIAAARQENSVSHVAGSSVSMSGLVPGLGYARKREKPRLSGILESLFHGCNLASASVYKQQIRPGRAALGDAAHDPVVQAPVVISAIRHGIITVVTL